MKTFDLSEDKLLQETACAAFLDPGDMFDGDGNLLPIGEMPEEVRRAIASLDVDVKDSSVLHKIKMNSKLSAIDLIAKIKGLLVNKVEVQAHEDLAILLSEARSRSKATVEFFS